MARLKKAPQRQSNPSALADAEAAAQQLLAESRASASRSAQPASVLGASLLNAARIHPAQASPPAAAGPRPGKLKRPSAAIQPQSRKTLARRGNLYDIITSSEKDIFCLPEPAGPATPSRNKRIHASNRNSQPEVRIPVRRKTGEGTISKKPTSGAGELRVSHTNGKEPQADATMMNQGAHARSKSTEQSPIRNSIEDSLQSIKAEGQGAIDSVFKFLDLEKHGGECQTKLGTTIIQICEKSCSQVELANLSLVDISKDAKEVRDTLSRVRKDITEDDYGEFKADAYGHVFRALVLYLQRLYHWFDQDTGNATDSIEAMRLLSPLMQNILAMKDTIASWRVSVPQRYHGDRTFTDVDRKLITPLRQVSNRFRIRLSQLQGSEQRLHHLKILEQKRKADVENESRRLEIVVARRERWMRWQKLHISRMQCEPDPSRRRKLVITKLEHFEEKDANGIRFERLPIFKSRSTPPWHWVSTMLENREWTDAEEIALLEGLQSFAGSRVFEKIFDAHCRPGGVLRDFNVANIVARATWARSTFIKLYRENAWEIPFWIKQIPVLP